jgi:hypothetical protein
VGPPFKKVAENSTLSIETPNQQQRSGKESTRAKQAMAQVCLKQERKIGGPRPVPTRENTRVVVPDLCQLVPRQGATVKVPVTKEPVHHGDLVFLYLMAMKYRDAVIDAVEATREIQYISAASVI